MRRVRIFNRQRTLALERRLLRRLAQGLLETLLDRKDYELGMHFIGAAEMASLNETFLDHHGSTDVITFNHQEDANSENQAHLASLNSLDPHKHAPAKLCGEIFISVDDALIHASRYHVCWPLEMTRYLVHGVLHLEGFNDTDPVSRRAMKRQESKLLKELSLRFDLGKLGRPWR